VFVPEIRYCVGWGKRLIPFLVISHRNVELILKTKILKAKVTAVVVKTVIKLQ